MGFRRKIIVANGHLLRLMDKYIILAVWFLGFLYGLANGVYAIMRPAEFLRAKWTITRSMEPGDEFEVRWLWGLWFLAVAGFLGYGTLEIIRKILNQTG